MAAVSHWERGLQMGKNGIKYESQEGNGLVTMTSVGPTRVVGLEGLVTISHF